MFYLKIIVRIKGDIAHKILRTVPGIWKQSMNVNYYYCLCELCIYNCFCCYYLRLNSGAISKAQCAKCSSAFPQEVIELQRIWASHLPTFHGSSVYSGLSVSTSLGAGRESWSLSAVEKAAPWKLLPSYFLLYLKAGLSCLWQTGVFLLHHFLLVQCFPPDLSTTSIMSAFTKLNFAPVGWRH